MFVIPSATTHERSDSIAARIAIVNAFGKTAIIFDTLKSVVGNVKTEGVSQNFMSDIEELKELAALKTQGLITEEEFAAMKAKVISR